MENVQAEKRKSLIAELKNQMLSWDGTAGDAVEIFRLNQETFSMLKEFVPSSNEEEEWSTLIELGHSMQSVIQEEQQRVLFQLEQLNKKDKVAESYLKESRPSIFVDKDF